jgi:hypothetical protein
MGAAPSWAPPFPSYDDPPDFVTDQIPMMDRTVVETGTMAMGTQTKTANPTCAYCGQQADGHELPLTWMMSVENGRQLVYCEQCARENLRSIESKLDNAWW